MKTWTEIESKVRAVAEEYFNASESPGEIDIRVTPEGDVSVRVRPSGDNSYIPNDPDQYIGCMSIHEWNTCAPCEYESDPAGLYLQGDIDWPMAFSGPDALLTYVLNSRTTYDDLQSGVLWRASRTGLRPEAVEAWLEALQDEYEND